jgi:hypothetical protein
LDDGKIGAGRNAEAGGKDERKKGSFHADNLGAGEKRTQTISRTQKGLGSRGEARQLYRRARV